MRRVVHRIVLATLLAAPAAAAWGAGRLSGYVTDENGQPLGGVTIEVTGSGTVGLHQAVSDARGFYELPGLPQREPLVVTARSLGLVPVVYEGLAARAGHGTRRDIRLRPPGVRDVIVVLDARVPYHRIALAGARDEVQGTTTVLELSGSRTADLRSMRRVADTRPNAILAIGSEAARLARAAAPDIPVVYTMVMDPGGDDLAGTNLCGVALNDGFEGALDRLAAMKPGVRRLLTLYDPRRLAPAVGKLRRLARDRGMVLRALPARNARQAAEALERAEREHPPDAFYLLLDPALVDAGVFDRIRLFAARHDAILIVPDSTLVAAGGTYAYAPGFREMGAYAGRLVSRVIVDGVRPAQIGHIFPRTRYFWLNPDAAQKLDLMLPPDLR
jgi:ABC-type uncharacterized transport system substrate-binding protein